MTLEEFLDKQVTVGADEITSENSSSACVGWVIDIETIQKADDIDAEIMGTDERLAAFMG